MRRRTDGGKPAQTGKSWPAVLEGLPGNVALIDRDGVVISANQGWMDWGGKSLEEGFFLGVGQNYLKIFERRVHGGEVSSRQALEGIRAVMSGSSARFSMQYPCRATAGQAWFRLMASPGGNEAPGGAFIMQVEITAQKAAEAALRQSEERFRGVFKASAMGIALCSQRARVIQANPAFCRMLGYGEEELPGMSFISVTHPEDRARSLQLGGELLAGRLGNFTQEKRYLKKNGEVLWCRSHVSLVRANPGEPPTVIVMAEDITASREAEEKLRWSNALFEAQVNSSPDAMIVVDEKGRKILQNRQVAELWGVPGEIASEPDFWRQAERVSKLTKNPDQYLRRLRHLDSHPDEVARDEIELADGRFFERHSSPMRGSDGKHYGRIWMCRDISGRKRTEMALQKSETRHRSLFDHMVEGYAHCRMIYEGGVARDYVYEDVNNAFELQTGLKLRDVVGKKVSEVIPGMHEVNPEQLVIYSRVAETGRQERFETFAVKLGIWFSVSVYSHEKGHFTVVFDNITERKRGEARFRRLVDSNVQGVFFCNNNGAISEGNDAFLRMVGHTRAELEAGQLNWMSLTPPEFAPLDRHCLEELAARGSCPPYEKEFQLRDGSRVPVLVGAAAFEDNSGEGVCFVIDLTERRNLEQQFFRAQRMESIGTLAGGIAHDLNNILAPILMSMHMLKLKAKAKDPDTGELLETIELSAKRGADVVRKVLMFARGLEGRKVGIPPQDLLNDLQNIIKDVIPKDIRLKFSVPENAWLIWGDPTQAQQILLNLSVNARDAMPNGGSLSIAVENLLIDGQYAAMNPQLKEGRYVRISVTDTGTGMPPHIMDKIFEPFFTTKGIGEGTGLGLSTVLSLVKSHDGFVNVQSEPGKGAVFNVYLPAFEESPGDSTLEEGESMALMRGNGETILLADDESSILAITGVTLQSMGYRVLKASNGAEAVAVYAEHRREIAVALIDMMMPIMDGENTIHALLRINPELRIIAVSGFDGAGSADRVADVGVRHFLSKPYSAETLAHTVRVAIQESHSSGHAA